MGDARAEEQQVVALPSTSGSTDAGNRRRPVKRIVGQQVGNSSFVLALYTWAIVSCMDMCCRYLTIF